MDNKSCGGKDSKCGSICYTVIGSDEFNTEYAKIYGLSVFYHFSFRGF